MSDPFKSDISGLSKFAKSDEWVAHASSHMSPKYLTFTTSASWAMPVYEGLPSDKSYSVGGHSIRIPKGATPMPGSDAAMIVYNRSSDMGFSLHWAVYNSSTDTWKADGVSTTKLSTNWLSKGAGGDVANDGHRGVPVPLMTVEKSALDAGVIDHALEIFWFETAGTFVWPMSGGESRHTGVVPEGYFLRLKSDAATNALVGKLNPFARIVARALQVHGGMIGDNAGGSKSAVKVQRGVVGLSTNDLSLLPITSFEFVQIPKS